MASPFLVYVPVGRSFPTFFASYCCAFSDTLDEKCTVILCRHSVKVGFFVHLQYAQLRLVYANYLSRCTFRCG